VVERRFSAAFSNQLDKTSFSSPLPDSMALSSWAFNKPSASSRLSNSGEFPKEPALSEVEGTFSIRWFWVSLSYHRKGAPSFASFAKGGNHEPYGPTRPERGRRGLP